MQYNTNNTFKVAVKICDIFQLHFQVEVDGYLDVKIILH